MDACLLTCYRVGAQNTFSISLLHFVDDTLLVEEKSLTNVSALKDVLVLFEARSRLKVNFNKIMLVDVNIVDSWLREAPLVMNCKTGRILFFYLGMPVGGSSRSLNFSYPLVERIKSR